MKSTVIKGATTGLAGALAIAGGSQAYGAIVNVTTPANMTTAPGATTTLANWDVDGDGVADFQFQDRYNNTDPNAGAAGVVWQLRMNAATTALASTNNVIGYGASAAFKYATALTLGTTISSAGAFSGGATTLILGSQYTLGYGDRTNYGGFAAGPNATTGAVAPGTNAYAGFRFASGGNTYYGWIQLSVNAGVLNFVNAAYNNTPGTAINAGARAVPEPGSMAALAMGAAAVVGAVAKRRRAKAA